jgi:glycosyltransferase involved in cell wall biosynthesis
MLPMVRETANALCERTMISETKPEVCLMPLALSPLSAAPLVSVLVANYNYAKYITRTIDSVLAQTYANWELIICDDGSIDESINVIERYRNGDRRIHLLRKENGGHGSALNAAYAASRGEIVCLLDSDDLFLPAKLSRIIECAQREPEAGFLVHRVIRINQHGRRQGVWPMSDALPAGWYGESLLEAGGLLANLPPTSGLSLRRDAAEALFPLPLSKPLVSCPDQVLMRLAPLLTPVAKIDEPLSEHRLHNANSYGAPRITAAFATREILICRSLWQAQHQFLSDRSAELAAKLRAVEASFYVVYLLYLEARLSGSEAARKCHAEMMRELRKQSDARFVTFWEWSIRLPRFVFDYAVNVMSRQSALKQLLSRLKGLI